MVMQVRGNTELDRLAQIYGILRNIHPNVYGEENVSTNNWVWSASPTPVCEVSYSQAQLEMTSGNALWNG